jgi:hypothetical protein
MLVHVEAFRARSGSALRLRRQLGLAVRANDARPASFDVNGSLMPMLVLFD